MADFIFDNFGLRPFNQDDPGFNFPEFGGEDEPVAFSDQLGTPIMSNLIFEAGSYSDRGQIVNFEGLRMDMVLMTVNQQKNIIKTQVQGRRGSVKEYISDGDFIINVKAAIVNPNSEKYPADDVRKLRDILRAPVALRFTSEYIDRFGSFDLVVDSYDFPQSQGFRNVQAVNINLISDNTIEIKLNEEQKITRLSSESESTVVETIIV